MSELIPVLSALVADAEAGRPAALCVVVGTQGSTPQAPGAAMLVRADFGTLGTLGGGCIEAEVRRRAFQLLQQDQADLLHFNLDHDYGWDDGLICGGHMSVAVLPVSERMALEPFREALALARGRQPASVPLTVKHEGRQLAYRLHLEVPPTLLIAGAGHVGQAVAVQAARLNFHVVVVDDRAEYACRARFPDGVTLVVEDIGRALRAYPLDGGCYVVIVTRGHRHDFQALDAVIRRPAGYLGLIGSRRKSQAMLRDLAAAGVPAEALARVHTPIGLPIGAVTVAEIAVSIAAELVQVRRQSRPTLVDGPVETADATDSAC
jgi:xanthine dehydrogenase accessory factor